MKIKELVENTSRYEKCLVWKNKEDAEMIKDVASKRDGVDLEINQNVMYFQDKFEFDHIVYHYKAKVPPERKPEIKLISQLTSEDFH